MSKALPSENTGTVTRPAGGSVSTWGLGDLQQRYRVLAKLGSGGMADVFLAMQVGAESFSRLAVVKRMRALPEAPEQSARMFFNEARLVASLSHPHIVKVFDLGWINKDIAMAMEYLDGESLHFVHAEAKKRGAHIPLPIILKLVSEAAEALHYAHTATASDGKPLNLIHRDVGLQNLLLTRTGYLKVIDFGVAKSSTQADVTTPGLVKGKIRYFAPETLTRNDLDGRADLYALGLVLFELVTLKQAHPFAPDATLAEVYERITTHILPPVTAIRDDIPLALNDVIRKATRIDRDERHQSGAELAEALRDVARPLGGFASTAEVEHWFQETFAARLEQRRSFEQRALTRLDRVGPLVDDATQFEANGTAEQSADPIGEIVKSDPLMTEAARSSRRGASARWVLGATLVFILFFTASFVIRASMNEQRPPADGAAPAEVDNLLVHSTPVGAEVFIDGGRRGIAGEAGLSVRVEPGVEHRLQVRLDGYSPYTLSVVGERYGRRTIDARLFRAPEESLSVTSTAPGETKPEPAEAEESSPAKRRTRSERALVARTKAAGGSKPQRAKPTTEAPDEDASALADTAQGAPTERGGSKPQAAPLPPPPPPVVEVPPEPEGPVTQNSRQLMARRRGGEAPSYPRRELERQLEGTVKVEVEIAPNGRVSSFRVLEGRPAFKRAVREVLDSWRFAPHEVRGQRVSTHGTLEIEFRLGS